MPDSFALPPVEYCFGTRPIHAANSPLVERSAVADRSHDRCCDQRADARDLPEPQACSITRGDPLYFMVQIDHLLLKILPLVPEQSEQVTHPRSEIFFGVL